MIVSRDTHGSIILSIFSRSSVDHLIQHDAEDHAEDHDAGNANPNTAHHLGVILDIHLDLLFASRLVGIGRDACIRLISAARGGDTPAPLGSVLHPAALQLRLSQIPGSLDLLVVVVVLVHRLNHLLLDLLPNFVAEHVGQDAGSQHEQEDDQQDDEVRQQHALDFLQGAETAEERYDHHDHASEDEQDRGVRVHGRSHDLGKLVSIGESPYADGEDGQAAHKDEEVGQEQQVLHHLTAALDTFSETHDGDLLTTLRS